MILSDKFFCKHYKKTFDNKNKPYEHLRNQNCWQSFIKSKSVNKINLTSLFIFEMIFNNANIVIKKATFIFVIKSITFYKFNLSAFIFIESIAFLLLTSLSIYRFMLSLSFTYKLYKKLYFTIVDLYMRYVSLNKSLFIITHIVTILFIIIIQNLYEKFYNKRN